MKRKMKMNIYIIAFCLIALQGFSQTTLDTLTLNQLIGLAQNETIAKEEAKLALTQARLDNVIFKADLKPAIDFTANIPNYSKTFSEIIQPDGSVVFQPITNNNSVLSLSLTQNVAKTGGVLFVNSDLQRFDDFGNNFTSYNGRPLQVGFYQPLFGFNNLKWEKALAPMRLQEAEKVYKANRAAINGEAVRLFFNLLTAHQDFEIAKLNKSSNESLYEVAKERKKLGKISENDLLQLRLRFISAVKNQKRAEQSVRNASADLFQFLGRSYNKESIVPMIPEVEEKVELNFAIALKNMKENRPELWRYQRLETETNRDLERAKKEGGLQADLTASFGLARGSQVLSEIYTNPQPAQLVQMQLTVPIVDWGKQKAKIEQATAQQAFLEKSKAQVFLEFEIQLQQIMEQFETIQEELKLVEEIKKMAKQRFEIAQQSFVLGAISTTELTFAQQEKDLTIREYIATLSQYWWLYYEIKRLVVD